MCTSTAVSLNGKTKYKNCQKYSRSKITAAKRNKCDLIMNDLSIAFEAFRKEIYGIKNQAEEFKVSLKNLVQINGWSYRAVIETNR